MLDGVRGGAAFYVLLNHGLTLLTALEVGPRVGRSLLQWLQVGFILLVRDGTEAVLVFFVLSGLVIHLRLARARAAKSVQFDVRQYAWKRFARIYPPLIGCLVFTAAFDAIGRWINPALYKGFDTSLAAFFGNALFLQGPVTNVYGSNSPLWSLAYEGFFYVMYPLVFVPLYRWKGPRWAFGLGLLPSVAEFGWQLATHSSGWTPFSLWGVWLLGAAVAEAVASDWRWRGTKWVFGAATLALLGLLLSYERFRGLAHLVAWGAVSAALLLGMLTEPGVLVIGWARRLVETLRVFAPQSYTLYLLQLPIIMVILAVYLKNSPAVPPHLGLTLLGVVVCLGATALIAKPLEHILQ